jgi:hypothetical protein
MPVKHEIKISDDSFIMIRDHGAGGAQCQVCQAGYLSPFTLNLQCRYENNNKPHSVMEDIRRTLMPYTLK